MGVMQALVSFVEDDDDELEYVRIYHCSSRNLFESCSLVTVLGHHHPHSIVTTLHTDVVLEPYSNAYVSALCLCAPVCLGVRI